MPYSPVKTTTVGRKVILEIELPERGELSQRGRAENLVDPTEWVALGEPGLWLRMTLCRSLRSSRGRTR